MRWLCACACVLALSLNGCSCSQRSTPGDDDGGAHDAAPRDGQRDGGGIDGHQPGEGGPQPDAGPWPDGGTCGYEEVWHLVGRTITSVSLLGATPRMGVTEQLLVEVPLESGSCEDLGRVDVAFYQGNATDAVVLTASVWQAQGTIDCTADAPVATTVVTVPGRQQGNLDVVVSDGSSPGGGLRLTYQRQACSGVPACQCYPSTPDGSGAEHSGCTTDCSCGAGLACIGYYGFAGPLWTCERPCADSRDCLPGTFCPAMVADGPSYVCLEGDQCGAGVACPAGFTCEADASGRRFCADHRAGPTWQPCQCDGDCSVGNRCVWDEDLADCLTTCRKDADCPTTGGLGYGTCSGSICLYYWE
jgi:hypothetical protein